MPQSIEDLQQHSLLGFSQLEHLNQWPLCQPNGKHFTITPTLAASSGSTLIELAMAGEGIVCLADFMTITPRQKGTLVEVLPEHIELQTQTVNAVYYRQATLSQRTRLFMEFLAERLPGKYLQG